MSVVFLDVATALRRYDAITVGDASPSPHGQVVLVDVERRDVMRYFLPRVHDGTIGYGYPILRGHFWTGCIYGQSDETHQRDRERQ